MSACKKLRALEPLGSSQLALQAPFEGVRALLKHSSAACRHVLVCRTSKLD